MKLGLGAYPTQTDGTPNPCYDADRPSLLPYWLDDFTEEACRVAAGHSVFADAGTEIGTMAGGVVGGVTKGLTAGVVAGLTPDPSTIPWAWILIAGLGIYAISNLKGAH